MRDFYKRVVFEIWKIGLDSVGGGGGGEGEGSS